VTGGKKEIGRQIHPQEFVENSAVFSKLGNASSRSALSHERNAGSNDQTQPYIVKKTSYNLVYVN
jgi:hypothetical protein